ncbi:MAG: hypothetical protein Q8K02_12650 [Flavobacterium sp.]|nr:hypothetical protein [Flavobacterium sp.]
MKRARTSASNALEYEDEIRKAADNVDEAKQIDEVISELRKVANESTAIGKSRLYRVQGGDVNPNISKFRFIFRNSKLEIIGKDRLHITFDDVERAIEFYIKRGDKAEVFTANINKSFLDKIKSEAVPQEFSKAFPTRPQIDDPTKTKGSFGLHESYFEELLKNISNPIIIKKQ